LRITDDGPWQRDAERLHLRGPYETRLNLSHGDKRPTHQPRDD
jgi:hypothetical protein